MSPDELTVPSGTCPLVPSVIGARVSVKVKGNSARTYDAREVLDAPSEVGGKLGQLSKNTGRQAHGIFAISPIPSGQWWGGGDTNGA